MLYVIIGEDRAGTLDQRLAARPAHVERLQALQPFGGLRLTLAEAPKDAGAPKTPVRFTMPTGAGALEFSLRLDGGRASP